MAKQENCRCESIEGWEVKVAGFGQGTWVTCEVCGGHAMNRLGEIGANPNLYYPFLKEKLAEAKKDDR